VQYTEENIAMWEPRLFSDGDFLIVDYVDSQYDFSTLYIIYNSYLYTEYRNGIITLEFMIPHQGQQVNEGGILQASKVISDNSLTLRRSFQPYLYLAKAYKTYHSTISNLDYWGVSYRLDASTDDFKALPLGLEVDYLDSNFGLNISLIVSGTSVGSFWSTSSNTDPVAKSGDRSEESLTTRYTDNNGN
jgi:hypothetical protein